MIFIAMHLGLGDAIACAPIVAKLAQENDGVVVPCFHHNKNSVKSLFVDYPNVTVRSDTDRGTVMGTCDTIRLGHYNKDLPQLPDEDFVQWFYRQAGMDIADKEKYCPIKKAAERFIVKNTDEFTDSIFVHECVRRGFKINKEGGIRPYFDPKENTYSILVHAVSLCSAKEVHCIDSSFLHLAEALDVKGKKVYHKYARPDSTDFKYIKGWEVLNVVY